MAGNLNTSHTLSSVQSHHRFSQEGRGQACEEQSSLLIRRNECHLAAPDATMTTSCDYTKTLTLTVDTILALIYFKPWSCLFL